MLAKQNVKPFKGKKQLPKECQSKKRYPDEFSANAIGIYRSCSDGKPLYSYQCPHCRGWHLTSGAPRYKGDTKRTVFKYILAI